MVVTTSFEFYNTPSDSDAESSGMMGESRRAVSRPGHFPAS